MLDSEAFLGDSADVGYTVDDNHHIRIDIQFNDDKTLLPETGEKEGKVKKKMENRGKRGQSI
ncbi:hypothetical protein SFC43_11165 [Bacteroides sp. CR5/BHMF/2]|nr:hypothetical protein [Bacteroides sp. CR5/BHMF/2]